MQSGRYILFALLAALLCGNPSAAMAFAPQDGLVSGVRTDPPGQFTNTATSSFTVAGTNGYAVWIGGIYEINNGLVLCHVYAGGQLVATFQPQCGGLWAKAFGEEHGFAVSSRVDSVPSWPFEHGRTPWTMFAGGWAAVLGVCLGAGRRVPLKRHEIRRALRPASLWRTAVTLTLISAFLTGSVGNAATAPVYSPVFYYYHTDHLGSSNVLTDRSGNVVQHYEYSTFGQTSYQNNTSAFPISNRYTGQTADDETGLYYYGGRYYDPQLGRFIQPDPTVPDPTDSQSLNRYSYCRNNPLNETDPSGFDDSGGNSGDDNSEDQLGGELGNLFGGNLGGFIGTAYDLFNSSSFSSNQNGFTLSNGSFQFTDIYPTDNDNGLITFQSGGDGWLQPYGKLSYYDDAIYQSQPGLGSSESAAKPAAPELAQVNPPSPQEGNGWLTGITNAAGLLAAVPIPGLSEVAGLVNAAGEALQGHYLLAGIGVATTALAVVGLGVLGTLAKDAAKEGQILYRGVPKGTFHDIQQAAGGAISPRGGNASMYEHVMENNTKSTWTSWTSDPNIARQTFAGPGGVVFWVDTSKIANKVTASPFQKFASQQESLIEGTVYGVQRLPNK